MGTRVYVGGIGNRTSERDLERFFKGFGHLRDVVIKDGFGFVEFEDNRDAEDAVYELNGKSINGARVVVEHARRPGGGGRGRGRDDRGGGGGFGRNERFGRGPPPRGRAPGPRTGYRLIVGNLSSSVSWQDLKDYMRQAGEVTYADAHKQVRNEGVIEFETKEGMERALDTLDDTDLNGRRITLTEDKNSRRSRSRSRSQSRSRSRSKSRSRSRSRSRSKSRENGSKEKSKSKSRSRSRDRSKSRSASPQKSKHSRSRSKSRSRSASPKRNGE